MVTLLAPISIMKLGEIILRKQLIQPIELEICLSQQKSSSGKIGELLLQQNLISEQDLREALQEQYWRRKGFWVID